MSSSKNTIVLTSIIAAGSLLLTYLVCANIAYGIFDFKWLSNSFLLAILSGIFASALVVLFCEIQKYNLIKKTNEDYLHDNALLLYSQLAIIQNTVKQATLRPENEVIKGSLDNCKRNAVLAIQNLMACDYNTFRKKQKLFLGLTAFRNNFPLIEKILNECHYFDAAIITAQIKYLQGGKTKAITGEDKIVQDTATILVARFDDAKSMCDELLKTIDYSHKYQWDNRKKNINDQFFDSNQALALDEYIKKYSHQ